MAAKRVPKKRVVSAKPPTCSTITHSNQFRESIQPATWRANTFRLSRCKEVTRTEKCYEHSKPQQKKRSLEDKLADLAAIEALNKQIEQTKAKRDKEKQFNRKRELNDQFKALKKQLATLHGS